jgi:hypothetical protein
MTAGQSIALVLVPAFSIGLCAAFFLDPANARSRLRLALRAAVAAILFAGGTAWYAAVVSGGSPIEYVVLERFGGAARAIVPMYALLLAAVVAALVSVFQINRPRRKPGPS